MLAPSSQLCVVFFFQIGITVSEDQKLLELIFQYNLCLNK